MHIFFRHILSHHKITNSTTRTVVRALSESTTGRPSWTSNIYIPHSSDGMRKQERRRENGQEIDMARRRYGTELYTYGSKITTHALALDCKTIQGPGVVTEAIKNQNLNVYDALLSISSHHPRRIYSQHQYYPRPK